LDWIAGGGHALEGRDEERVEERVVVRVERRDRQDGEDGARDGEGGFSRVGRRGDGANEAVGHARREEAWWSFWRDDDRDDEGADEGGCWGRG
jgi:hypothetical protein